MKSIMEDPGNRTCWGCGGFGTERHHVFFGTAFRKKSEKYGLTVHLCYRCHRDNRFGVHGQNRELDKRLKKAGQKAFEVYHGTRKQFMDIFGENHLEDEKMNRVILMGRLTRDPEVRYSQGDRTMAIARYTLAVDRRGRKNQNGNEQQADFINCIAFDKAGEFAEKYFRQGQRVLIAGRIQTGSYTNRDGQKVYTTDVIVDEQEFADSKGGQNGGGRQQETPSDIGDGFMNIPDGVEDEGLPFN